MLVLSVALVACQPQAAPVQEKEEIVYDRIPDVTITGKVFPMGVGPAGYTSVPSGEVYLGDKNFDEYIEMARSGNYDFADQSIVDEVKDKKIAIVMHYLPDDWTQLQIKGISDVMEAFGVEVTSVLGAEFKSDKHIENLENVITMGVDLIYSVPVDAVAEASTYQKVADAGIEIILATVLVDGFEYPDDYGAIVANADRSLGIAAADQMAHFLTEAGITEAQVGVMDYSFPVPNTIERVIGFKNRIAQKYPWIDTTLEVDYDGTMESAYAVAEGTLAANPGLDGFFGNWAGPAFEISNAARTAGFDPDKFVVTTVDLTEYVSTEVASQGFIKGVCAQDPYAAGVAEALAGIKTFLGEQNPPHITTDGYAVTNENLLEAYEFLLLREPPQELKDLMK